MALRASTGAGQFVPIATQGQPYFKVRRITSTFTIGAATVVQFNSTVSDTAGKWDGVNFRYVPNVAGRWAFFTSLAMLGTAVAGTTTLAAQFYLNGSLTASNIQNPATAAGEWSLPVTLEITMNGTTDFIDVRGSNNATGPLVDFAAYDLTYFHGHYLGPA